MTEESDLPNEKERGKKNSSAKKNAHLWSSQLKNYSTEYGAWVGHLLLQDPSMTLRGLDEHSVALDEQILRAKHKLAQMLQELDRIPPNQKQEKEFAALKVELAELKNKEAMRHLLNRVGEPARRKLKDDASFITEFDKHESCQAFVISIDLRGSTELMLKARQPKLFAEFITTLAKELQEAILENFGVFDKFTGDGILAFFPEFYSGEKAGLLAVEAATICHRIFEKHYWSHRRCFNSVSLSTGLGIGIDFGPVSMVQIGGELTVVGTPVVYACRLGGAPAGTTLVNQPAYEQLLAGFSSYIDFDETSIDFKHEGKMLAYRVSRNENALPEYQPSWVVK